ncbi:MAG: hypothetical protein AB8G99_13895 [Planctomycetaceae bacterium]
MKPSKSHSITSSEDFLNQRLTTPSADEAFSLGPCNRGEAAQEIAKSGGGFSVPLRLMENTSSALWMMTRSQLSQHYFLREKFVQNTRYFDCVHPLLFSALLVATAAVQTTNAQDVFQLGINEGPVVIMGLNSNSKTSVSRELSRLA